MNLTNSTEPLGGENAGVYKSEPHDMGGYFTNPSTDSMNPNTDMFFGLYDELTLGDIPTINDSKHK